MKNRIFVMIFLFIFVLGVLHAQDYPEVINQRSSSYLEDSSEPRRYSIEKLYDADLLTSWVEGVDGPGIGEWIELEISPPVQATSIQIMPGYFDSRYWHLNNRVAKAEIQLVDDEGSQETITVIFPDLFQPQTVAFSKTSISRLRLTILEVYEGDRWDDTCIAEIAFFYDRRQPIWTDPALAYTKPSGAKLHDVSQMLEEHWFFYRDGTFEHERDDTNKPEKPFVLDTGRWFFENDTLNLSILYQSGFRGVGEFHSPDEFSFGPAYIHGYYEDKEAFFRWTDIHIQESWEAIQNSSGDYVQGSFVPGPYDDSDRFGP